MIIINLKNFYPWYTQDEWIEVADEIAEELFAARRSEKAYQRRVFYNKSHYSVDLDDGIEASAIVCYDDSPERVLALMERHCRLCHALCSLPEIQARRIEMRYFLGMSINEIAAMENAGERNIRKSIQLALRSMKKFF